MPSSAKRRVPAGWRLRGRRAKKEGERELSSSSDLAGANLDVKSVKKKRRAIEMKLVRLRRN